MLEIQIEPIRFNYAAKDADGKIYLYIYKPVLDREDYLWRSKKPYILADDYKELEIFLQNIPYSESLTKLV